MLAEGSRCPLVKENSHSRDFQGAGCVLKDSPRLFQSNSGKPFQEFRDLSAVFEILEKCGYRNAGAPKYPRPAHPVGIPLNSSTCGPINHGSMLRQVATGLKVTANARLRGAGVRSTEASLPAAG